LEDKAKKGSHNSKTEKEQLEIKKGEKTEKNGDSPRMTEKEIKNLDLNDEKIKRLMKKYERETGKYAIWRGAVTEGFKKWL